MSNETKKCISNGLVYETIPLRFRCKNCLSFWISHEQIPDCHSHKRVKLCSKCNTMKKIETGDICARCVPTGEDLDKMIDDFTMENGVYKFRSKPAIKEFVSQLLLSKEKQWKDEMAGKIPKYRSFEESNSVEYYHGRNDFRNEMLSLLSNNQEE